MSDHSDWQPTANHAARVARASMLASFRSFFAEREVLEVDTPLLSAATVTDVYLDAFSTQFHFAATGKPQTLYLQTSPEYAMKRLLCAQSGPVYQICKAFRHEGHGRWHNPEFTMLEWYRPGFDHHQLMGELDTLIQQLLCTRSADKLTYQEAFIHHTGLDPLACSRAQLLTCLDDTGIDVSQPDSLDNDTLLQLLFSTCVEAKIGDEAPCFIYDFPASQSALARISYADPRVAHRFELYYKGAELANGFFELRDADEQHMRFTHDNRLRAKMNLPQKPVDEHLLSALRSGLPDCAGVAVGIDRLLMLKTGASHINEVLNFPVSRA